MLRFLVTYLLVLVLPILVSLVAYRQAFVSVREGTVTLKRSTLDRAADNVDRSFSEIDRLVTSIANSRQVARYLLVEDAFDTDNFGYLIEAQRNLPRFEVTSEFVQDYAVYFARSQSILSPTTIGLRLPVFFSDSMNYTNLTFDEWYRMISAKYEQSRILPPEEVRLGGLRRTVVTYLKSVPVERFGAFYATVAVLLHAEDLARMIDGLLLHEESWAAVIDQSSSVILALGAGSDEVSEALRSKDPGPNGIIDTVFRGAEYQVMSAVSGRANWRVLVGTPASYFTAQVAGLRRLAVVVIVVSLLFGSVLATLLAYRSSEPVRQVIPLLRSSAQSTDPAELDLASIPPVVAKIVESNQHLRDEVLRQEPIVRDAVIERLLRGETIDPSALESLASHDGPLAANYICLIVHILGFDGPLTSSTIRQLNVARVVVNDSIQMEFGGSSLRHDIEMAKIAVIVRSRGVTDERCYALIADQCGELRSRVQSEYSYHINIYGGRLVRDLSQASVSFREARSTSSVSHMEHRQAVLFFDDTVAIASRSAFPLDTERELHTCLRAGNLDRALSVIRELYRENVIDRSIDGRWAGSLIIQLQSAFVRLLDENIFSDRDTRTIQESAEGLLQSVSVDECFDAAEETARLVCGITADRKRSHNTRMYERVLAVIADSFDDHNTSVGSIADVVGISETYLSQFFKDQSGETFISYLTRMRVEKARSLLEEDKSLSMEEVANAVGYSSSDTFRKAFKRVVGISPSRVRLLNEQSSNVDAE